MLRVKGIRMIGRVSIILGGRCCGQDSEKTFLMTRLLIIFLFLSTISCQTSESKEKNAVSNNTTNDTVGLDENYSDIKLQDILEKKKGFFENILFVDIKYLYPVPKDTLIVHFQSLDFCGNSPIERIDPSPLFDLVRSKATKYGFKEIVNDTADILLWQNKNLPFYILNISAYKNRVTIFQSYSYEANKLTFSSDTTIDL